MFEGGGDDRARSEATRPWSNGSATARMTLEREGGIEMGIRKNAKFLTAAERESFVRACVLMKADIVNPAAAPADQYSRWDELVAIYRMIQSANASRTPSTTPRSATAMTPSWSAPVRRR